MEIDEFGSFRLSCGCGFSKIKERAILGKRIAKKKMSVKSRLIDDTLRVLSCRACASATSSTLFRSHLEKKTTRT